MDTIKLLKGVRKEVLISIILGPVGLLYSAYIWGTILITLGAASLFILPNPLFTLMLWPISAIISLIISLKKFEDKLDYPFGKNAFLRTTAIHTE